MNLTDTAIERYVMHEMFALHHEEQRLKNSLENLDGNDKGRIEWIVRALARLDQRASELDVVLDELDPEKTSVSSRELCAA